MDRKTRLSNYLIIVVFFSVYLIFNYYNYIEIQRFGKYAIGEVTNSLYTKKTRKEIWYKFNIDKNTGLEYKGVESPSIFSKVRKKINKGDQYLVIYSTKNPTLNTIVLERQITEFTNIDSLNLIGIDKDFISFWHL